MPGGTESPAIACGMDPTEPPESNSTLTVCGAPSPTDTCNPTYVAGKIVPAGVDVIGLGPNSRYPADSFIELTLIELARQCRGDVVGWLPLCDIRRKIRRNTQITA